MKQPTHFIDVYRPKRAQNSSSMFNGPFDIRGLDVVLFWNDKLGFETIAIWKIYPKKAVT